MHRRYAAHVALLVCSTAAFQRAPLQASPVTRRPLSARTAEKPKPRQRPHGAGRARQGRKRGDLLRDIIDAPRAVEDVPKAKEDPLIPFVECLAKAADGRKATRTCAFHTAPLTDVASFVVAACGRSRPQNDAIAAAVVQDARENFGREPKHVEGGADGGWTRVDRAGNRRATAALRRSARRIVWAHASSRCRGTAAVARRGYSESDRTEARRGYSEGNRTRGRRPLSIIFAASEG